MNRTFHADDWPTFFDECEAWSQHKITDGETVDRLYQHYLADDSPLFALMALKVPQRVVTPMRRPGQLQERPVVSSKALRNGLVYGGLLWLVIVALWYAFR